MVEVEYRRMLQTELKKAVSNGEPERAAAFAKALAMLRRKELAGQGGRNDN